MSDLAGIENTIDSLQLNGQPVAASEQLLGLAERVLEAWVAARHEEPTRETKEGFRLLALHKQGSRGVPSFNACRETCREIVYHYNLIHAGQDTELLSKQRAMMAMLVKHLSLFVSGKMQVEGLGEFCCASKPLRLKSTSDESTFA